MPRVYVSSTIEDLHVVRQEVHATLRKAGLDVINMEDSVAESQRPLDRCLEDVRSADVYVGIFAFRYGCLPPGSERSFTEHEYDEAARDSGIEKLCFLLPDDAQWVTKHVDTGDNRTRIDALRRRIREAHGTSFFKDAADLCKQLALAVSQWQKRRPEEPEPIADAALHSYARRMCERFGSVELDGLILPAQNEQLRIALEAVYVEQCVRRDRPPELPKDVWGDPGFEPAVQSDAKDSKAGSVKEQARVLDAWQSQPLERVFAVLGHPERQRHVILGDPGAGKSMLTRYILLSLLQPNGDRRVRQAFGNALPLLVELRSYVARREEGLCESFLDYFDYLGRTEGHCLRAKDLEPHLRLSRPTLVILDGLDEIFNPELRATVAHQIAGLAATYPHARLLVTSRIVGYSPAILSDAGFEHYTLQDLELQQIQQFSKAWFGTVFVHQPEEADLRCSRLMTAVESSDSIRQLASNPLLLTIMAIIGRHQELPRERVALYRHAAAVLVEHWDVQKHLASAAPHQVRLGSSEKMDLLRRVAWKMQAEPAGLHGNHIRGEDLRREMEAHFLDRFGESGSWAHQAANAMIALLRERDFILSRYGAECYGFVHRSFLEYFCASSIVQAFERTQPPDIKGLETLFASNWDKPEWAEVLRLVTGMLQNTLAGQLLSHLAINVYPRSEWPRRLGDRFPINLILATQCLAEVRGLGNFEGVGGQLLGEIAFLVQQADRLDGRAKVALDRGLFPAVHSIGVCWPGKQRVRDYLLPVNAGRAAHYVCQIVAPIFCDDDEVHAQLTRLAEVDDLDCSSAALLALAEWCSANVRTQHCLYRLANAGHVAAIGALVDRYRDDSSTLPLLRKHATAPGRHAARAAAITALAKAYAHAPGTLELLIDCAEEDDPEVCGEALLGLATAYRQDVGAVGPIRKRGLESDSAQIRRKALRALALGGQLSHAAACLVSRDLDGWTPFLDPREALSVEHIQTAQSKLAVGPTHIQALQREVASAFGVGADELPMTRSTQGARGLE